MRKEDVIKLLDLKPLTGEGGFVKEMYRSDKIVDDRNTYGTIYYLLTPNCFSCMHTLSNDEIWYYHDGPALEMLLVYEDYSEIIRLGKDITTGEHPQFRVPAGVAQGCRMTEDGEYTLVSTSMAPAYAQEDFTANTYEELEDRVENKQLLRLLTGKPKYE